MKWSLARGPGVFLPSLQLGRSAGQPLDLLYERQNVAVSRPAAEPSHQQPQIRAQLSNIIREGKNYQLEAVIQTGAEFGMQNMDRTLVNLVHAGSISYDEARNYAVDVQELDRLMRG